MYQALYRKWRPLKFSDVVGQKHITDTIKSQIISGKFSHAYLFTGTRGTGKTTCAKILSRAVNCENPINGDPCNECASCKGILDGSILDVVEIDAASNNGVENIRDIREETRYTPGNVKKRVYIIDEVHMLSTGAFNALLKTLEEPPSHVLFILATTEIHKVPATILSRCQRFDFRRILSSDIENRLIEIAEGESIPLSEDGAKMIARMADGGMRDAISILDRAASGSYGIIDEKMIAESVGILSGDNVISLMRYIKNNQLSEAIKNLNENYVAGRDLGSVLDQLLGLIRDILIVKTSSCDVGAIISPAYSLNAVKELSNGISGTKLSVFADTIQLSISRMPRAANKKIEAELCVIKMCQTSGEDFSSIAGRIEELEEKIKSGVVTKGEVKTQKKQKAEDGFLPPWNVEEREEIEEKKEKINNIKVNETLQEKKQEKIDNKDLGGQWGKILQQLKGKINVGTHTNLQISSRARVDGNNLIVITDDGVTALLASTSDVRNAITKAACDVLGKNFIIKVIEEDEESSSPSPVDDILKRAGELNIETSKM